jgi:hypothetical protein
MKSHYQNPLKSFNFQKYIPISTFTYIFICILFNISQAVELPDTTVDTLGNWYNLGRVSGNKTYSNNLCFSFIDDFSVLDFFHYSTGNNRIETGISLIGPFLMLPEIDFTAAPSAGNRLSACITTPNVCFAREHNGFEDPIYFSNSYSWDYLSNRGIINVEPSQYENSFYFGPQLNQGQLRTHVTIAHSIQSKKAINFNPLFFNSEASLSAGIFDFLSFVGNFSYLRSVYSYNDLHDSYYNNIYIGRYQPSGEYKNPDLLRFTFDTSSISGMFSYRSQHMTCKIGYNNSHYPYPDTMSNYLLSDKMRHYVLNNFFSDFTLLIGNQISSLDQVNGNWDGFFSPILGKKQFLAHIKPEINFYKHQSNNDVSFTFNHDIHFGLRYVTIGESGKIISSSYKTPSFINSLTATLSNIALRTRGPEQVSKFEYTFGYWPRKGEFRIDATFRFPIKNVLERSQITTSQKTHILNLDDLFNNPRSYVNEFFNDRNNYETSIIDYDHRLKISVGISDFFNISNDFTFKTDYDGYQARYAYMGGYLLPENNKKFSNQFSIHAGNAENYMHSLSATIYFQEKIPSFIHDHHFDFYLSYIFALGF